MTNILYPTSRRSAKDLLFVCDACGAAEWSLRYPPHECPARRDGWGRRTMTPMRLATASETAVGLKALEAAA